MRIFSTTTTICGAATALALTVAGTGRAATEGDAAPAAADAAATEAPASDEAAATDEAAASDAEAEGEEPAADAAPADKEGLSEEEKAAVEKAKDQKSPVEEKGKSYYFIGARYRAAIVPKFYQNLFIDGGGTQTFHMVGPEFIMRKDGAEVQFTLSYINLGFDPTLYKGKNEDELAYELVNSAMHGLYLEADFLWSHSFNPQLALNYGFGAGLGFTFGDLFRAQAYPTTSPPDPDDSDLWAPCAGVGNPDGLYCDGSNDRYPGQPGYEEQSWFDGGSKPFLIPWFALQTGLRYKPHRNFAARFDVGWGVTGFFLGLGLDYGL